VWEVYKPEAQRRWGYYTLPILYQDRLVARTDLMLERTTSMPVLKGFRLESHAVTDNQLITALAYGFKRFMRLIEAQALDALFSVRQHCGMGYGNCFLYLNRYRLPTREGGSLSDAYRADFRHSRQLFCPGRRPG
jgi:hypothetical protein